MSLSFKKSGKIIFITYCTVHLQYPESIEWYIKDQAFLLTYDVAPPSPQPRKQVVSLCHSSGVSPVELILTGEGGEKEGEEPSQRESLILFKIIQYSLGILIRQFNDFPPGTRTHAIFLTLKHEKFFCCAYYSKKSLYTVHPSVCFPFQSTPIPLLCLFMLPCLHPQSFYPLTSWPLAALMMKPSYGVCIGVDYTRLCSL